MTSPNNFHVEKLLGEANYGVWAFGIRMVLVHEELFGAVAGYPVDPDTNAYSTQDTAKDQKALAKIALTCDKSIFPTIRGCKTAKEAWDLIKSLYAGCGLQRRILLLRKLLSTNLQNSKNMEDFVTQFVSFSQELSDVGNPIDDELLCVLLLSGLPESYDPLVIALENSSARLTLDSVKQKLLSESVRRSKPDVQENALASKFSNCKKQDNRKCSKCFRQGHLRRDCFAKTAKPEDKKKTNEEKKRSFFAALTSEGKSTDCEWIVDSGATGHFSSCSNMKNFRNKISAVMVANNEVLDCQGQGDIHANVQGNDINIEDVLLVPKISANLLSVSRLSQKGYTVVFDKNCCRIFDNGLVIKEKPFVTAGLSGGLYKLNVASSDFAGSSTVSAGKADQLLWHRRLAHLNIHDMNVLKSNDCGVDFQVQNFAPCIPCVEGKMSRKPFMHSQKSRRADQKLAVVHSDVWGPSQEPSIGGARYYVAFTDDFSRHTVVYFMKGKHEVFDKFKVYKAMVENQSGFSIKMLRSDGGGEYVSNLFDKFLATHGIKRGV